jgi:hypothetical protein
VFVSGRQNGRRMGQRRGYGGSHKSFFGLHFL